MKHIMFAIRFVNSEGMAFDWEIPSRRVSKFRMNPTWTAYFSFRLHLFGFRRVWFSNGFEDRW